MRGGGDHANAFLDALAALRGALNAMTERLDALEHMLGCEGDARKQSLTHGGALAARCFGWPPYPRRAAPSFPRFRLLVPAGIPAGRDTRTVQAG